MPIKPFIIFVLSALCVIQPASASANSLFSAAHDSALGLGDMASKLTAIATFSIKKGEPYSEANDPVFQTSNPEEGPQHGYFAVPLLVIGLAGILLYFSRNE